MGYNGADYVARHGHNLPTNQEVAGSNPAGRAIRIRQPREFQAPVVFVFCLLSKKCDYGVPISDRLG